VYELELVQNVTIECIANLAENRDNETGQHIRRTKLYIKLIAEKLRENPDYKEIGSVII
jgi:putative two-component system response regulator